MDIRFDLDEPGWTYTVQSVDGTKETAYEIENESWAIEISGCTRMGRNFHINFLKLLVEIAYMESGSRYVRFGREKSYDGTLIVNKRNSDTYEITLCEYRSEFDIMDFGGPSCVGGYGVPENLIPQAYGETLPEESLRVQFYIDGKTLWYTSGHIQKSYWGQDHRKFWYTYPVKNTLNENDFFRFISSAVEAFQKYSSLNGLEYFRANWLVPVSKMMPPTHFPYEELAELKDIFGRYKERREHSSGASELGIRRINIDIWKVIESGDADTIELFIKTGADVKAGIPRGFFLWKAIESEDINKIELLIKAGVDVNARIPRGFAPDFGLHIKALTLLMYAVWKDNAKLVRALLKAGADVNAKDENDSTALMRAVVYNSNPEIVYALLDSAGVDVNAKDKDGKTALKYAVQYNNNPEIVYALRGSENVDVQSI
jgi:hypothetical protein